MNGYLIAPFDCDDMAEKLMWLMKNEDLRTSFAAHAQDNVEKFQVEGISGDWDRLLGRITSDGDLVFELFSPTIE